MPYRKNIPSGILKFLRVLILIQLSVSIWFALSPDFLPEPFIQAERQTDEAMYAILDGIIVPLVYLQTLLCLAIWWPTRIVSLAYLGVAALIAALGALSGVAVLSALDALLGYLQVLASGAMLGTLWTSGFLLPARAAK